MQTVYVPQKRYQHLYFQVLAAIVIGILLGHFYPETGVAMKPLGDGFIKLIKMIIAPIIFCTVVTGIAGIRTPARACYQYGESPYQSKPKALKLKVTASP